jgi:hypothetical protein
LTARLPNIVAQLLDYITNFIYLLLSGNSLLRLHDFESTAADERNVFIRTLK